MRRWNKKVLGLAAAGVLLAGTASVGKTYAYFTTYVQTAGTVAFQMGVTRTEIDEKVKDGKKIVSVKNTGDYDCYVRVTAFAGSDYTLTFADGGTVCGRTARTGTGITPGRSVPRRQRRR